MPLKRSLTIMNIHEERLTGEFWEEAELVLVPPNFFLPGNTLLRWTPHSGFTVFEDFVTYGRTKPNKIQKQQTFWTGLQRILRGWE